MLSQGRVDNRLSRDVSQSQLEGGQNYRNRCDRKTKGTLRVWEFALQVSDLDRNLGDVRLHQGRMPGQGAVVSFRA